MKAIRVAQFGGPEVLQLKEVPDLKPSAGQVVVRIRATGVNPVDTYIRSGNYARKPELPYTPGTDGAGTVEASGPGAARFAVGDRVYLAGSLSGTYAEQALCEERLVFPLPANVSFSQGAAMHVPYATAYRALFHRAQARGGETVLIHGASGGVGIAAVQLARAAGLRVTATVGSDRGRKLVAAEGAHHILDHKSPGHFDEAFALTGGRGFGVILEMLANVNLGRDLTLLAPGGRVVVIGCRGSVEINPRDAMSRDASILGMSLWNASPEDLASIHSALVAGLENETLRPVIGQEIPFSEAARAHTAVMEPGAYGKIVLVP
ncbi:MAG TPA: NADPH:quinone reductase [Candidatus Polarisedimenticolia bacterium]|nr:NADPH:quinone reductase [Candidatus Polarisedimenticolia bacterium]